MVLTSQQITQLGIVHNPRPGALQPTTYNATVREIISEGKIISEGHFDLPPRGIVWVVSNEEFELPETVTGLATLKTTWTHDGILALNVGIVDPGWYGPLAAALVNFSKHPFPIKKDAQFLRIAFHKHNKTGVGVTREEMDRYISRIKDKSAKTPDTFLDIKALSQQVIDEVFTLPRWLTWLTRAGLVVAVVGLAVAFLAILVPIAWDAGKELWGWHATVNQLQHDVDTLKKHDHIP
jgi:deoxycytidine triphosphate deaminase